MRANTSTCRRLTCTTTPRGMSTRFVMSLTVTRAKGGAFTSVVVETRIFSFSCMKASSRANSAMSVSATVSMLACSGTTMLGTSTYTPAFASSSAFRFLRVMGVFQERQKKKGGSKAALHEGSPTRSSNALVRDREHVGVDHGHTGAGQR